MRNYLPEYDEYSETNKFLDMLFKEDQAFEWSCTTPQEQTAASSQIIVSQQQLSPEDEYLASLVEEIKQKLDSLLGAAKNLDQNNVSTGGCIFDKEEVISRLISLHNTLDTIIKDCNPEQQVVDQVVTFAL